MQNGGIGGGLPAPDSQPKKLKVKEFLSSGSWTRPVGVDTVEILLVGGGGGSGGLSYSGSAAVLMSGAGGGGGVVKKLIDVTAIPIGQSVSIVIGSGGAAGSAAGGAGGVGGSSSFGSLLTALGGGGGDGYPTVSGVTTGIATHGGGAALVVSATYGFSGMGGGAGGSPGVGGYGAASQVGAFQQYKSNTTGVIAATTSSAHSVAPTSVQPPKAGPSLYGYGGGGGCSGYVATPGEAGAGTSVIPSAQPNTGGGACGMWQSTTSYSSSGAAGGSGYALISWWE